MKKRNEGSPLPSGEISGAALVILIILLQLSGGIFEDGGEVLGQTDVSAESTDIDENAFQTVWSAIDQVLARVNREYPYWVKGIVESQPHSFNFDELSQITLLLDQQYDELELEPVEFSQDTLEMMIQELHAYYAEEGFVDWPVNPDQIKVEIHDYLSFSYLNTLGSSDCQTYIEISSRFLNQFSPHHNSFASIMVAAHEMAHINQGEACPDSLSATRKEINLTETSAQIMSVEVLAAMANDGSPEALKALLYSLRLMALNTSYLLAVEEDRVDEFVDLYVVVNGGGRSEIERALRKGINVNNFTSYARSPLMLIFESLRTGAPIEGLVLTQEFNDRGQLRPRAASISDLRYVLVNLEEMVKEFSVG